MKKALTFALLIGLAACASKKTISTADALRNLNNRWQDKIGVAAKSELTEEFGQADWCEQKPGGSETCRFYHSMGIVWKGDKDNRTKYDTFDEIIAEFDPQGILRDYKARSQR